MPERSTMRLWQPRAWCECIMVQRGAPDALPLQLCNAEGCRHILGRGEYTAASRARSSRCRTDWAARRHRSRGVGMSPWYAALSAHRWPTLLLHRRRLAPASRACCSKCSGAAPALLWQASLRPSYQLPCCPAPLRGPACRSAPRALSDASNTAPPRRVPGRCGSLCTGNSL